MRRARTRRWIPAILEPETDPAAEVARRCVADRDQLERGFRRVPVDQRAVLVLHHYLDMTGRSPRPSACRSAPCDRGSITRAGRCAPPSRRTPDRR